jgi:hypothetical protein
MGGSIDPRCETLRGTHWPIQVVWLLGTRVAETILASGPNKPHQQAGHMDASDPIRPQKPLVPRGPSTYGSLRSQGRRWEATQMLIRVLPGQPPAFNSSPWEND